MREIKITVLYLEVCNRKDAVLYSIKSKLLNVCMSGYNVTHISSFYVRLQDGNDGLILCSGNVIKLHHCDLKSRDFGGFPQLVRLKTYK